MTPAQPPFPTASNLPFQPETGSQTSTLMSESLLGASVAVTRQKDGSSEKTPAVGPRPCRPPTGGANAPAATVCASVIVVFGSFSDVRLSQAAALAALTLSGAASGVATSRIPRPPMTARTCLTIEGSLLMQ